MHSLKIIELLVTKKKIVKVLAVYALYGHGGHLGHVTETIFINSCQSFPKRLTIRFVFDVQKCLKEKDV